MPDKKEEFGQIQIADEVVAVIAATAAMEIEGVLNASSASGNALVEFFGKKSQTKGVKVNCFLAPKYNSLLWKYRKR